MIRIESGGACECDDVAGSRVERHDGSSPAGERVFRHLLHAYVQSQNQIVARHRKPGVELRCVIALPVDRPAGGIDQDLPRPALAVELLLVRGFDAQLADERGARIFVRVYLL